ncbi:DUF4252 domain-containing protein, partial [Tenacibaculum maritimum]
NNKIMRKIILLIVFIGMSSANFGQSIFDKLEDMDGVSSVIVNKDAFEILSKFKVENDGNEAVEIFNMIKNLEELKVFKTSKSKVAAEMESMVNASIKKSKMIELMRAKDEGSRVKIYVASGKNKDYVKEVLMYAKGFKKNNEGKKSMDAAVISLTGLIDINKLSEIADTIAKEKK